MKRFLVLFCMLLVSSLALAETINLKDGKVVMGKIIENTSEGVKVDVAGVTMTYYPDEIKDIDGKAIVTETPQAVISKEVTKPETTQNIKEDSTDKKALILKFIDVFGTRKLMAQNFDLMLNNLSQEKPDEAAKIRDRVKVDEIINRLVPLYDKHFTSAELKAYIDFYSSPIGQKLLVSIGEVMKESIQVSADYMKEKFPEEAKQE